eukprot:CAMPEP_0197834052 /NCGR_PEP_ID=MMETSP1437-20131217/21024_1 /TAXON_ID=49252 ORGANISM="Eucampia antarctica, Strain CCMP1452" /NCGR_SAMPLE_ID=MMETSP1437 /ASSEMBLY_ACC=CAM_ASM_001096 /LENGTH=456 /DNA_ID=CAMNT_0043438465 /DNA_START=376 /DNA_END=1746 /DNA_ORIENTATION=+
MEGEDWPTDPSLHEMRFDMGYGEEVFNAYLQPDISSFSQGKYENVKTPDHSGWAVKFLNLSPAPVDYYWVEGARKIFMGQLSPFNAKGTASFPNHNFIFTREGDEHDILASFKMTPGESLYFYDPIEGKEENLAKLTNDEWQRYEKQKRSQAFAKTYKEFTGRNYLSLYPRPPPSHKLWMADHFGQTHWVTSKETHFTRHPPQDELKRVTRRKLQDDEPRLLSEYRSGEQIINMTLEVISCAPRVLETQNFLSDVEVDHIIAIAGAKNLHDSTTAGGSGRSSDTKTRTSRNTWVKRNHDPIIDSIYRRAADLLRIDEALLRDRDQNEFPHLESKFGQAEQLQLVHYNVGEQYTAHHDFGYPDVSNKNQPARFATLLLYLNEDLEGGHTEFPRWANGETSKGLFAKPARGKAVLFYSQLPDGNMDDLSHHAALPVKEGEKWLINLWVWDPVYEVRSL